MLQEYESRLSIVRHRFASTLESKITESIKLVDFPRIANNDSAATSTINNIYRRLHQIYAIAPTVGFPKTGKVAHEAEAVLMPAQAAKRGLTQSEFDILRKTLAELLTLARSELQLMYNRVV